MNIKLYLYDSTKPEYKGEDLSQYVLQGLEDVEDITQELDTTQIVLVGIDKRDSFLPGTKFILELGNRTVHRKCQNDIVTQPILEDKTYFKHDIALIEPSVDAQKRTVDNISVTYKLKDVTLDTIVKYPTEEKISTTATGGKFIPSENFGYIMVDGMAMFHNGKYFEFEDVPKIVRNDGGAYDFKYTASADLEYTEGTETVYKAKIKMPKLRVYAGDAGAKTFSTYKLASTFLTVKEKYLEGTETGNVWNFQFVENNSLYGFFSQNSPFFQDPVMVDEWLPENATNGFPDPRDAKVWYRKYADRSAPSLPSERLAEFYVTPDRVYELSYGLYTFDDEIPEGAQTYSAKYAGSSICRDYFVTDESVVGGIIFRRNLSFPNTTAGVSSIVVYTEESNQVIFRSGGKYSAMETIEKAVCNTEISEKIPGVRTGDINAKDEYGNYIYPAAFYVDPDFVDELSQTDVIENFYTQKNLWEVLVEAGHYIHSIPEIVFDANDKMMITFKKLGQTKEVAERDVDTTVSIMNFRGIDDYICMADSYITNMVQLGGEIQEWVAPKNSDENFLTYNDTAEIIVSKGILELTGFQIKCNSGDYTSIGIANGAVTSTDPKNRYGNALNYIFEENVYAVLPIKFATFPNKGVSLYYSLRDNKIVGGNYQLPQTSPNMYSDYALKKVIYCAFHGDYPVEDPPPVLGDWSGINVNDFTFRVTYRTQDDIRQTHSRPDIRKYLVSSKFDPYPIQKQFNNQTDIVVDSEKFGSNMYGKLIRTGNLNYQKQEWVYNPDELKRKGEIERINGDIYYISRVTNTFYSSHIMSVIEYSKDYNQLSQVIGIPSEPRFYEISEQSATRRNISIEDFLVISTELNKVMEPHETHVSRINMGFLRKLMIGPRGSETDAEFPRYAITTFKGDSDVGEYATTLGDPTLAIDVISPVNTYTSFNTLTYSWDMKDNFSAGDKVGDAGTSDKGTIAADGHYTALQAVQYTDQYGKATLADFYVIQDISPTFEQVQNMPNSPIRPSEGYLPSDIYATNNWTGGVSTLHQRGLQIIKDCREAISFNYNIHAITNSDQFVTSPFLFDKGKKTVKVAFLTEEVNKLSNGYFDTLSAKTIDGNQLFSVDAIVSPVGTTEQMFHLNISALASRFSEDIRAIVLTSDYTVSVGGKVSLNQGGKNSFVIARNIPIGTDVDEFSKNWYFGAPNKETLFNQRQ